MTDDYKMELKVLYNTIRYGTLENLKAYFNTNYIANIFQISILPSKVAFVFYVGNVSKLKILIEKGFDIHYKIPANGRNILFYNNNYKVINHQLTFKNLPSEFDDFKIAHISDFHCGSFDNHEKLKYGITMVMDQKPDIILFTGDMVNNMADEVLPWKDTLSLLNAPYGMFAILGNHDYGDYVRWESEEEKIANQKKLIEIEQAMGFNVLLNSSVKVSKNDSFK